MARPRILVSNDDGIQATGIQTLARALEDVGEVWVVAPSGERSAISHAISLHAPLRLEQVGERRFQCDGTPTDCVYLALNHVLPEAPDVVVSGVNHGPNLANDVIYSGTVSAAMEGSMYGHRALAVSLVLPDNSQDRAADSLRFDAAAQVAQELTEQVLKEPMPLGVLLNVNVPNRARSDLRGIKLTRLGYINWAEEVNVRHDPRGRPYYWIGGARLGHDAIDDSDNDAVADGYVSVTPVHYDLTDYRSFAYTRDVIRDLDAVPDNLGDQPLPHPVRPSATGKKVAK